MCSVIALALMFHSCAYQDEEVDLVVHNAIIYTVDGAFTKVEAMAIDSGRVVAVGAEWEILNKYKATETLDAAGASIFPGFIDSHTHFIEYGLRQAQLDLSSAESWADCLDMIEAYAREYPEGWITGGSWDQNNWDDQQFPDRGALSELIPDRPVLLNRVDLHSAVANDAALKLAKINGPTQVRGGEVVLDENKKPTGILIDKAVDLVSQYIPKPSKQQLQNAIKIAEADCAAFGITSVVEAGLDTNKIGILRRMTEAGDLKTRVYAMLEASGEGMEAMKKGPYRNEFLSVRSVKIFSDGALGSRGAALKHHYHDHPVTAGGMLHRPVFFKQWAALCDLYGFQLNTHCIGDKATQLLLAIYEDQLNSSNDKRWRIEHAQVVTGNDMEKFGRLNILPSVQPTHATSDKAWAEERLGPDRIKGAYANKDLLEQNGLILLGTDFPVESIDPFRTFYSAVFRKDENGEPRSGWYPEQALTRKETLLGMTLWGAIGMFEENHRGSLEPGKVGDFVILDRDIMTCPEEMVLDVKVMRTFIAGEQVYGP